MSLETWILFVTLAFFISATPGPVMMLATVNGATYGLGGTLLGIVGVSLGNLMLMLISGSGVGALLQTSQTLLPAIQWLGATYLIYLGWRVWHTPIRTETSIRDGAEMQKIFSRSFLVAASNPKGLVFFAALFPQFIAADKPLTAQLLILIVTFLLIDGLWQLLYAAGGNTLRRWLKSPARAGLIARLSACVLAGSGLLLAIANMRQTF